MCVLGILRPKLQFNLDKCHILPFRPTDSSFVLNSATLENVSNEKNLGVIVSSDLSWTPHIRKQCQKAVSVFFLIRRNISSSVSVAARLNLYKSMIVPVLTYNSQVWFANESNQKSLESVQRRVTQWILSYQTESYFERMKTLNILPITLHLQICDLLTMSKIVSNHYDFDWFAHVNFNDSLNTRSGKSVCLSVPRVRLAKSRQNFFHRITRMINSLPLWVDYLNSIGLKQRIIKLFWMFFNCYYSTENACTWVINCDCNTCICNSSLVAGL